MDKPISLPASDDVSALALSRIFGDVTNSYKFLFFQAFLDNTERSSFDPGIAISIDDLIIDMLVLAWYPHVYFKLSFGKQDQISRHLDTSLPLDTLQNESIKPWDKPAIRRLIAAHTAKSTIRELKKYVPYRLISPFFPELKQLVDKDSDVNLKIAEMSAEYFPSRKPLYKFEAGRNRIFVHPLWCLYLEKNLPIIRGWAAWQFLDYMQARNPSVPAVSLKLFPVAERTALTSQSNYWKSVLASNSFRCIYTGDLVLPDDFTLDHFVPWSFVVHDQLWNLVPTSKSTNSRKSNFLPSNHYLTPFVQAQHAGLLAARAALPTDVWGTFANSLMSDLGFSDIESMMDRPKFANSLERTILPLLRLAETNGFALFA